MYTGQAAVGEELFPDKQKRYTVRELYVQQCMFPAKVKPTLIPRLIPSPTRKTLT